MTQEERTRASRSLILNTAAKEFALNGYKHASVNRICEAGHISKGKMFHHFKDKDDIFVGIYELFYSSLGDHMENFSYSEDESLEDILNGLFRQRQSYIFDHPYQSLFLRNNTMAIPEHLKDRCAYMRDSFYKREGNMLHTILDEVSPEFDKESKEMIIRIFGVASNYVHLNITSNQVFDPEKDMSRLKESNAHLFGNVIHTMLYGIYPRD